MNKTIVLDAGHGGKDAGAVNGSRYEKDDALRLTMAVGKLLQDQGHSVVYTRKNDTYTTLQQRTDLANRVRGDLFVSIHRNSFTSASANGTEVWVYTTAGSVDVGAATEVLEQLAAVGVQSNRGVKKGNYHVLRESDMPSMLVELGFISNAIDNKLFDDCFHQYAQAIAAGICNALGLAFQGGQEKPKELYRVQIGAFTVRDNAENFLETVRGMGLEAFLVAPGTVQDG